MLDHHALGQTGGTGGVDHIGQVIRTAVDPQVMHRGLTRLHLLPDQQPGSIGTAELIQQCHCLFTACRAAHQQRRMAQLDDPAQALTRQVRVQRQVTGTGLEAADDHPQQVWSAFREQRHWLIHPHPRCHQGMTQAVTALVELAVAMALIQATDGNVLWIRVDLGLEQFDIALLQRVVTLALVAGLDQEVPLLIAQHGQVRHVAVEAIDQCQQQSLELAEHAFDR
ncbi:hypothetical protein D3C78_1091790 [compost metagenome]